MICAADTVGVFQIESRAQMSMLPRLKPAFATWWWKWPSCAPAPSRVAWCILPERARSGAGARDLPRSAQGGAGRTHGVPIFQEQVMQIAVAAGFTPGEADGLRRSMAAWKRHGG